MAPVVRWLGPDAPTAAGPGLMGRPPRKGEPFPLLAHLRAREPQEGRAPGAGEGAGEVVKPDDAADTPFLPPGPGARRPGDRVARRGCRRAVPYGNFTDLHMSLEGCDQPPVRPGQPLDVAAGSGLAGASQDEPGTKEALGLPHEPGGRTVGARRCLDPGASTPRRACAAHVRLHSRPEHHHPAQGAYIARLRAGVALAREAYGAQRCAGTVLVREVCGVRGAGPADGL